MAALSDFSPFILPYAPAAPDPIVEQYLRIAADEFCQRTRAWRAVETIDVVGDEQEIICVPPQSALFEIEEAWWENKKLRRVAFADVSPDLWPVYDPANPPPDGSAPEVIAQVAYNSVTVAPRARGSLRLSMFLKPAPNADELPDHLFEQFPQALADGALARILVIPNQPYTNPDLAAAFAATFNAICDRNFARNIRGQQRAPVRARASFV